MTYTPRRLRWPVRLMFAVTAALLPTSGDAKLPQGKVASPSPALVPGETKTNHEIGATVHVFLGPAAFVPQFNWRVHFPRTAGQGKLSGLFLGLGIGPAIDFDGDVDGDTGLHLGYEFDPWSNLALTFSPLLHNDILFDANDLRFMQTVGLAIRLYVKSHWVILFEPGAVGWSIDEDSDVGFAFRAGWGVAYKF